MGARDVWTNVRNWHPGGRFMDFWTPCDILFYFISNWCEWVPIVRGHTLFLAESDYWWIDPKRSMKVRNFGTRTDWQLDRMTNWAGNWVHFIGVGNCLRDTFIGLAKSRSLTGLELIDDADRFEMVTQVIWNIDSTKLPSLKVQKIKLLLQE